MARGLKFHIQEGEGLDYLCSENKGADQLRGYREADLRLCFRICKKNGFLMTRPICRVRNAHLSPGLPTGLTRVNPGWVLSLILEKVGNTG